MGMRADGTSAVSSLKKVPAVQLWSFMWEPSESPNAGVEKIRKRPRGPLNHRNPVATH